MDGAQNTFIYLICITLIQVQSITNYDSDMKQAIRTISGPMVLFQPIPLSILDDPEWD